MGQVIGALDNIAKFKHYICTTFNKTKFGYVIILRLLFYCYICKLTKSLNANAFKCRKRGSTGNVSLP